MGRDLFLDFANTQSHELIGAAVDLYHLAREAECSRPLPGNRSRRLSDATIIHCVVALEATINSIAHDFLFDPSRPEYIKPDVRNVPIHLLRQAWPRSLTVVEKLRFVLDQWNCVLPDSVSARLLELIAYRNWIAHGYIFRTQLLLEYVDEKEIIMHEHDREDSVRWSERFPHLKFSPLDSVAPRDAQSALRVMLEVLALIAKSCGSSFEIMYINGGAARVYHERGEGRFEEVVQGTSAEMPDV